jgi:hypothetical protein
MLDGRWKLLILFHLFGGKTLRFSDLERAISGVSQKMLAQQLRQLERDGVVGRTVHPEVPPSGRRDSRRRAILRSLDPAERSGVRTRRGHQATWISQLRKSSRTPSQLISMRLRVSSSRLQPGADAGTTAWSRSSVKRPPLAPRDRQLRPIPERCHLTWRGRLEATDTSPSMPTIIPSSAASMRCAMSRRCAARPRPPAR